MTKKPKLLKWKIGQVHLIIISCITNMYDVNVSKSAMKFTLNSIVVDFKSECVKNPGYSYTKIT